MKDEADIPPIPPIPPKRYTVSEFAKAWKHSEDFVRRCCREYVDKTGRKYELPVMKVVDHKPIRWQATQEEKGKDWFIEPPGGIAPSVVASESSEISFELLCESLGTGWDEWFDRETANSQLEIFRPSPEVRFATIRHFYLYKEFKRHFPELTFANFPYRFYEQNILKMLPDAYIGKLLGERWAKGIEVADPGRMPRILKEFEDNPSLAPPAELDLLLGRIREAYRTAQQSDLTESLQITFKPDGTWLCERARKPGESETPFLDLYLKQEIKLPPLIEPFSRESLFWYTWEFEIRAKKGDALFPDNWKDIWYESVTEEFCKRCLYCGAALLEMKSNARYCTTGHHRSSYKKWIDKTIGKTDQQRRDRLLERIEVVRANL